MLTKEQTDIILNSDLDGMWDDDELLMNAYDSYLNLEHEPICLMGYNYCASVAYKQLDPIRYHDGLMEYVNDMLGKILYKIEHLTGPIYYYKDEVDELLASHINNKGVSAC